MKRREFLGTCTAALLARRPAYAERIQPHYRQPPPYQPYIPLMEPGHDEFPEEKAAMEMAARLREWWSESGARGEARFYLLPDNIVRFEIRSPGAYKTGVGKIQFDGPRIAGITAVEEYRATAPRPLFRDVTGNAFQRVPSFAEQLSRGVPYWIARLDPATGIQIYGSNGIAVGDIDNDGVDEVYVCQPGGLPNRLYKNVQGRFVDISAQAGVDILDETSCALFLDLRNLGRQDMVILCSGGPALLLNNGDGTFRHRADAFQFATLPQGSFTGMAAGNLTGMASSICTFVAISSFRRKLNIATRCPTTTPATARPISCFATGSMRTATADSRMSPRNRGWIRTTTGSALHPRGAISTATDGPIYTWPTILGGRIFT